MIVQRYPLGHFHSPVPDISSETFIQDSTLDPRDILGIDLRETVQNECFGVLLPLILSSAIPEHTDSDWRYYLDNGVYTYFDGMTLAAMLRQIRPNRYVEVGSGFSTALALDVSERFLNKQLSVHCIEPHTTRLLSLLKAGDLQEIEILETPVQSIPPTFFECLKPNDVLFIDGSHVLKAASDLNYVIFEILPRLNAGVYIHFHDIFYPFEYPKSWLEEGIHWNEAYALRAFLMHNSNFQVEFWTHYFGTVQRQVLERTLPLAVSNIGASLWLRRL